jgi:hypothetical protein
MFKSLLPAFLIIFLASCSSTPVKVFIDKKDLSSGKISIDSKQVYNFKNSVIDIDLMPGKHSFILNNDPSKDFTVGENGGLLNLDNQEYVAYEVEYSEQNNNNNGINFNTLRLKAIVLIDSFVIIPKSGMGLYPDSSLRKILPKLQESVNGNYFFSGGGTQGDSYDTNESIQGIKKFGKGKLYIERFWDYSIGEKIPQTLTVTTTKSSISFGNSSTTRNAVIHVPLFLLSARLSPDEYSVKKIADIIVGKNDKQREKIMEDKQMKF